LGPAVVVQPVGVDEPRPVLVGGLDDRVEEGLVGTHRSLTGRHKTQGRAAAGVRQRVDAVVDSTLPGFQDGYMRGFAARSRTAPPWNRSLISPTSLTPARPTA